MRDLKAVILAGGEGSVLFPLANYHPKLSLPVAGMPLMAHYARVLGGHGVRDIIVILSKNSEPLAESLKGCETHGVNVEYVVEERPMGTAGCLKEVAGRIGPSPFWVISSNIYIRGLDLREVLISHRERGAGLTMVVFEQARDGRNQESVSVCGEGYVRGCHAVHHSKDNRSRLKSAGVYLFEPWVLDEIPDVSYFDIKGQLIPRLNAGGDGRAVNAHVAGDKAVGKVDSLRDYFNLNRGVLLEGQAAVSAHPYKEFRDRVWTGENASISPDAFILGPVLIGDNCRIDGHAKVIGPTTIGDGVHIGKGAVVHECIIHDGVRLMDASRVEYCFVGSGCVVPEFEEARGVAVVKDSAAAGNIGVIAMDDTVFSNPMVVKEEGPVLGRRQRRRLYHAGKRLSDAVVAAAGLLALIPLFLVVAALIRLDSPGPVFYAQKRCGKDGRPFRMFKFRTMSSDAETRHCDLSHKNEIDGPMFKMKDDPRITKAGALLRKTSIDELPQLLNVLMGEMSLVGPRPLIMDEMLYAPNWRDIRLLVKPGITGLWQVSGRSDSHFQDWITNDIRYIKEQSFMLDMRILLTTIEKVLFGFGAR